MPPSSSPPKPILSDGDAKVLKERSEVGPRAERADAKVVACARLLLSSANPSARIRPGARFHDRHLRLRISTSLATPLMNFSSACEPSTPRKPRAFVSVLM